MSIRARCVLSLVFSLARAFAIVGVCLLGASAHAESYSCDLTSFQNHSEWDAALAIQTCIERAVSQGRRTVAITPAGDYYLYSQIRITTPGLTLVTANTPVIENYCWYYGSQCVRLHAAGYYGGYITQTYAGTTLRSPTPYPVAPASGLISVEASDVTIADLFINGHVESRRFAQGYNNITRNITFKSDRLTLVGNVLTGAIGSASVATDPSAPVLHGLSIHGNGIALNGMAGVTSDGLYVLKADQATLTNNIFVDNTDVSLITFHCTSCTIQGNYFGYSGKVTGNAALVLQPTFIFAPGISGDGNFAGTNVRYNQIYGNYVLGGGIEYGNRYELVPQNGNAPVASGALVSENTIVDAIRPLVIQRVTSPQIGPQYISFNRGRSQSPLQPSPFIPQTTDARAFFRGVCSNLNAAIQHAGYPVVIIDSASYNSPGASIHSLLRGDLTVLSLIGCVDI